MALPVTGSWSRQNVIPYATTTVWGTGINSIHAVTGEGDAVRLGQIHSWDGNVTLTHEAVPDQITEEERWGYTPDDTAFNGIVYDGRPGWNEQPATYRGGTDDHPSWSAPGAVNESFRGEREGARKTDPDSVNSLPSETVSEGWLNKPKGQPADAKPSNPSQYEIQTSMVQRYKTRDNDASVNRGTDESRTGIMSRVVGQKLKIFSGGERHYDMFPRQQTDIPRAFYYRTAGTGPRGWMFPNAMYDQLPIERIPPDDPQIGLQETNIPQDYGYTGEDPFYA
jgi:hypothetical protein